jgi:hypothetical protein
MPRVHRHPHAGARHEQSRNLENLAALVAKLDLFLGVTVLDNPIVERHYIECDRSSKFLRRRKIESIGVAHQGCGVDARIAHLGLELAHAGNTPTRYSLIGANHHSPQAGGLVQWLEHRHCRHRRAIRVRHDSLSGRLQRVRVDLGDNERNVRVHAPRRRVVNYDSTGGRNDWRKLKGGRRARREEDDVEPSVISRRRVLDGDFRILPPQPPAGRARRGE